jgi:putative transposase
MGTCDSFAYPQHGFKIKAGKLHLSKIGDIKVNLHRRIEGIIKRLALRRTTTGKWFTYFSVETDVTLPPQKEGPVVGIDVCLESFATLSNGEMISHRLAIR